MGYAQLSPDNVAIADLKVGDKFYVVCYREEGYGRFASRTLPEEITGIIEYQVEKILKRDLVARPTNPEFHEDKACEIRVDYAEAVAAGQNQDSWRVPKIPDAYAPGVVLDRLKAKARQDKIRRQTLTYLATATMENIDYDLAVAVHAWHDRLIRIKDQAEPSKADGGDREER